VGVKVKIGTLFGLRFDQDAYWGLGIGASIMGRVPFIGAQLVHLMLAGSIIAGETLSRFFTLHVFIVPGLIIALLSLHLRLVLTTFWRKIRFWETGSSVSR